MLYSGVPLGVLPAGTANVLANELGFGNRLERAVERLASCVPGRVAAGKLCTANGEHRFFLLMGGIGLDAAIVRRVNPKLKGAAGKLAYWIAGCGRFFHSVGQFDATVNGVPRGCGFALVSRVRNYGGDLEIAGGASLLRNDFEVVLFRGSNPLRYGVYMFGVLLRQVQAMPGVSTLRAKRIEFSGNAEVQIDGEYGGRLPARFEIVPDAVTLMLPPGYR